VTPLRNMINDLGLEATTVTAQGGRFMPALHCRSTGKTFVLGHLSSESNEDDAARVAVQARRRIQEAALKAAVADVWHVVETWP
jgi:hypothetical protein